MPGGMLVIVSPLGLRIHDKYFLNSLKVDVPGTITVVPISIHVQRVGPPPSIILKSLFSFLSLYTEMAETLKSL